jgi:hypothetical protein
MCNRFTFSKADAINDNTIDFLIEADNVYKIEIIIDIYLRNHLDVAVEYLEIAFVAQELSKISEIIKTYETPVINNYPRVVMFICCKNSDEVKNKLKWFKNYFSGEFDTNEDEKDAIKEFSVFNEEIRDEYNSE